ncbi:MAG TPA: Lacal_2735 family protein [Gillisia sp.]|nr:Lacal_2735 family protein [Gillisia sp.]
MFGNLLYRNEEERLSHEFSKLMSRSFKMALVDKEKSDKLNARANKILKQLKRINYKDPDKSF